MSTKELSASDWIRLRAIVIQLGEDSNWWPAKILTGHGEQFLAFILPKTKMQAAFQLATEICQLDHDKEVGIGKFHLFRLPEKLEEDIFFAVKSINYPFGQKSKPQLLEELKELASSISVAVSKGPVLVGAGNEINDPITMNAFAKHYLEAFSGGHKTFPYLN